MLRGLLVRLSAPEAEVSEYLLECDNVATCRNAVLWLGTEDRTVSHARAKGWHLYQGPSWTGKYIDVKLCPSCIGTSRSRLAPAPQNLDGQLELDLGGSDE